MGKAGEVRNLSDCERSVLEFLDRCDGGNAWLCVECIRGAVSFDSGRVDDALGELVDRGLVESGNGYRLAAAGRALLMGHGSLQPA